MILNNYRNQQVVQTLGRAPIFSEEVEMKEHKIYSEFEHFYKLGVFDESENAVPTINNAVYRYKSLGSAMREAAAILERANGLAQEKFEVKNV